MRRLVAASAALIGIVSMGGTGIATSTSSTSPVRDAVALRGDTASVLSSVQLGTTTMTVVRDSAGTYTVVVVKDAPGAVAYLVRGNLPAARAKGTTARAWIPGRPDSVQTVPFRQSAAAALPAGCTHWRYGPFGAYGHMIADSATDCNSKRLLMTNAVYLHADNASTSLDFDMDRNVNVDYLASRAIHPCNGSARTTWRARSEWQVGASTGTTDSGWKYFYCGY